MLKARRGLLIAAAALLLVLIVAFGVRKPGDRALYPPRAGEPTVAVWLIDNGFHTSLVLPVDKIDPGPLAAAVKASGPAKPFVEIGWGDAKFYIETGMSPHRVLDVFRAAFAPNNPSAVMIEPLHARPDLIWRSGVHRIDLSPQGYRRLEAGVERSLALKDGAPELIPGGDEAWFYRSTEHFSLTHLCNHWAAQRLNDAGLPIRPVLDTAPAGLVFDLETGGATVHRSVAP
ncbi:MAG TPA: DUF2459 domain-containing protein [Caulobacteraceae bacterium]